MGIQNNEVGPNMDFSASLILHYLRRSNNLEKAWERKQRQLPQLL